MAREYPCCLSGGMTLHINWSLGVEVLFDSEADCAGRILIVDFANGAEVLYSAAEHMADAMAWQGLPLTSCM